MTISDETLMAYADGELDAAARAAVESAMREDPQIEMRVAAHRTLRRTVQAAYSAELSEAVPERLLRAAGTAAAPPASNAVNREWRTAWTIAASLVAGVGLGFFMWGQTQSPLARNAAGALVARGPLAKALSNQLAAEQSRSSAVQIGLSFRAKSGDYCRTFALSGAVSPSGLACRQGAEWQVQALTQEPGAAGDSGYRTAASAMPAEILKAVEGRIAGEPLDQAGERTARQRNWMPADR
jgi:hypothetical protein